MLISFVFSLNSTYITLNLVFNKSSNGNHIQLPKNAFPQANCNRYLYVATSYYGPSITNVDAEGSGHWASYNSSSILYAGRTINDVIFLYLLPRSLYAVLA